MNHDNKVLNVEAPGTSLDRSHGQSQDAIRHEKDALHHKFHKGLPPEKSGGPADSEALEDGTEPIEGQQEIPKVGSRDALGG